MRETKGEANRREWELLLAKTNFELGCYEEAIAILEPLVKANLPMETAANAKLLLALSYRDGLGDLAAFCLFAEEALQQGASLLDLGSLHACLFNAYFERSSKNPELLDTAGNHLFAAFQEGIQLRKENLAWLSDRYFQQIVQRDEAGQKVDPKLLHRAEVLLHHLQGESPSQEVCGKLGKIYLLMGNPNKVVELLEPWAVREEQVQFLLAQAYAKLGEEEKAMQMFEGIVVEPASLRKRTGALALLHSARLHWKRADPVTALKQLKDLVLQKTLANEPIHLEAALDYINLQSEGGQLEKRVALLKKSREDFEASNDLLAKDYHEARIRSANKNQIYQGYMRFFDAEIFTAESGLSLQQETQKELQAKAKHLLLLIIEENAHPALVNRAVRALQQLTDAPLSE